MNGDEIGFGPNPATVDRYYYDSYDVTSRLRKGRNTIAILAYNFGYSVEHDTTYADKVGGCMIFQGELDHKNGEKSYIISDETWKTKESEAWQKNTSGYTELRHGLKEYVNGAKDAFGFIATNFNDSKWNKAEKLAKHPMPPFYRLVPREIKHFQFEESLPINASGIGYNYAYGFSSDRGWEILEAQCLVGDYPKASDHLLLIGGEKGTIPQADRKRLTHLKCTVNMIRDNESPSLLLDFGKLRVGRFKIILDDAPANARIDIAYGESMNLTYIDRYTTRKGPQTFSPFHRRVARYAMLTFSNLKTPLTLEKVSFDHMTYPVDSRGEFNSSDTLLNKIWTVANNTTLLSMYDHFEDCPWREQKIFAGDTHVQALVTYYAFKEYDHARKCLHQIALIPRTDGWIAPAGPAHCLKNNIIDFPARYIISLLDYTKFSGDLSLIREVYPIIKKQLNIYKDLKHKDGLIDIGTKGGFENWCFINWGEVSKQGIVTAFNCLVIQAFEAASQLASFIKEKGDSQHYSKIAENYREAVNSVLWDERQKLYVDSVVRGRKSSNASVESNVLALISECATGDGKQAILKKLCDVKSPWLTKTAFFNLFLVEALFQNGKNRQALNIIRRYWGEMINRGADTFWEIFDHETPSRSLPHKFWSLCHGWSAGPIYLIGAYILGVKPIKPGFSNVSITPCPLGIVTMKGKVPTPHGDISVSWDQGKGTLRIKVPKKIKASINLKYCSKFDDITVNGKPLLSTDN